MNHPILTSIKVEKKSAFHTEVLNACWYHFLCEKRTDKTSCLEDILPSYLSAKGKD